VRLRRLRSERDSPPEPVLLSTDRNDNFVHVPFVARCGEVVANAIGEFLASTKCGRQLNK
jgi:hypothetical protein